nr:lipoprotein [Duganella guangzhouensis]
MIILSVLLSGCGQPGPLYLPKSPAAKAAKSSTAPAPTSEPAATQQ